MEQDIQVCQSELIKDLPDKCTLRHAICTTMSIDPSTMLQTIVQLAYPSSQALKKVKSDQINTILGGEDRFWFFHDASLKDAPLSDEQKAALWCMAVPVECSNPFPHVFHPKIILLEYENKSGETFYRLQVSSKNLTSNYHFEVGALLESQKISGNEKPNHNLGKFLWYLAEKAALRKEEIDREKNPLHKKKLERIAGELERIAGELNSCRFLLLCDKDKDKRTDRVQVTVSGAHDGLGTQASLIECLKRHQNKGKDPSLLILSPSYETSQEALGRFCVYQPIAEETHAKLYFEEKTHRLWLGSSNLSQGGMENNVECMVEISDAEGICHAEDDCIFVFGTKCEPLTATTMQDGKESEKANPPIENADELIDKLRNDALRSFLDTPWFCLAGKKEEQAQAMCDWGIEAGERYRNNPDLDKVQQREAGYAVELLRHYREYRKNCADRQEEA